MINVAEREVRIMLMILLAAGCYTICSLADKYAVSTAKLAGTAITFIMAAATSVFMTIMLPFMGIEFPVFSWQLAVFVLIIATVKMLEFLLAAKVLKEMSAFELKAWLGITLFISYFVDAFVYNGGFSIFGVIFIAVTAVGLFLIAKSNGKSVNYKKIILPLIFYILVKFGYGAIMRFASPYGSSSYILYFALILLTVALFPVVHPVRLFKEKKKGVLVTAVTKFPNAVGLFAENAALSVSLTGYSLIQPIILIALFLIGVIRKEYCTKLNLVGAMISILGIICFQLFK